MTDQEYQGQGVEAETDRRLDVADEAPLGGTVLLDDVLDAVAGGLSHVGEEIPQ